MKNESQYVRKFAALLKRLRQTHPPEPPPQRDPVTQLVVGFLEWNATRSAALAAHERIMGSMVDNNDLRVSHPHEVVALLGERYPLAEERAARLHESLQDVYLREHAVSLESLAGKPKKQARTYLDTLSGMTPYVAAQVALLNFGAHGTPCDERLVDLLRGEGSVEPTASVEEVQSFLERHIPAEEAVEAHLALRAWADAGPARGGGSRAGGTPGRSAQPRAAKTARRTAKKTTKKSSKKSTKKSTKKSSKKSSKKTTKKSTKKPTAR